MGLTAKERRRLTALGGRIVRGTWGRIVVVAVLAVVCVAAEPAAAMPAKADARSASKRPLQLKSVGRVPQEAVLPGDRIVLKAWIKNRRGKAVRPRVRTLLRPARTAAPAFRSSFKRTARVRAKRARRVDVAFRIPANLPARRYLVRVCAKIGKRVACRYAKRRLAVGTPPADPPPVSRTPPAPRTPPTPRPPRFRVLALTESAGGRDPATDDALTALRALGARRNFAVTATGDSSDFTDKRLAAYRAVLFVNTVGDVLTDSEQQAFERYFRAGGGFVAINAAIGLEPDWEFLDDALGTRAKGAPFTVEQPATIKVADRGHAASRDLPEYWRLADRFYNFTANVRGVSHVLATLDESTVDGGTMGPDHPAAWCKDHRGGRAFYTMTGGTARAYADEHVRVHLAGALTWTAGLADPVYSDCGATVLANYQQTKISAPPNLNEPIGFDQLPDGRLLQTARGGQVRLHDPETATTKVIATLPVYTGNEDGLYGPAVDNDFAVNKWVYLYYAPETVHIRRCDGTIATLGEPVGTPPVAAADPCEWTDDWQGYFQLSRFKFVDGPNPTLDLDSEQKILRVADDRGSCCHVAGDIDFDRQNNLWLATGDDTPSGGGGSEGFSPFNDQKADEIQSVRTLNATGGTITLSFDGETTAPLAFNAAPAATEAALEALAALEPADVVVTGGALNAGTQTVRFTGAHQATDVPELVADATALTGTNPTATVETTQQGDWFNAPFVDARRTSLNTNDLRGKLLRIKVLPNGDYAIPEGNLFPEEADAEDETRPEIYAMGFRNPFRIQVDSDGVAYVTDYSPDGAAPQQFRGPSGIGRVEIVRKPSNYGWPLCATPTLPYYPWNFSTATPLDPAAPQPFDCDNPHRGPENTSRWNTGRVTTPPVTAPDIWYSYRDNANPPAGTPCFASYGPDPLGTCPQLFPELYGGGVGPHGAAKYEFDPDNPSPTKLPAYYDDAVFLGEFTQDTLREVRLDSEGRVFKINPLLDCASVGGSAGFECDSPMDMQFGADGHFYLLTYGDGFFAANPDAGLYRWEYVKGTRAPRAVIGADRTSGTSPLSVAFTSDGSTDPDPGDSIRYEWDFEDDGLIDSIDPAPSHTYTANGVYTARLTVFDASGKRDSKTTTITVGNTAPTVTISTPVNGSFFAWGDEVPFTVSVTDPEDGTVDCDRVQVTFVLVHDTHGHAEESVKGCSGVLHSLAEDASHGGYIAGGISAAYTDDGANGQPALTTTTQHLVQTRRQEPEFVQREQGTSVGTSFSPAQGPFRLAFNDGDWMALNNRYALDGVTSVTARVNACGTVAGAPVGELEVRLDGSDGPLLATLPVAVNDTAQFCSFAPRFVDVTAPIAAAGSREVYLVPRAVDGGPTSDLFRLDWVQFNAAP